MKKIILLGILAVTIAACNKNMCKTENCKQCADACTISCSEENNNEKLCKKICQCVCVNVENGASFEESFETCL